MNEMIIAIDSEYTIDVTINSSHMSETKAKGICRKFCNTEVGKVKNFMEEYCVNRLIVVIEGYISEYRR